MQVEYKLEHDYCLDMDCVLGEGSFGVVRRGFHIARDQGCAVKSLDLCDEALEELQLQEALRHPNVCRVLDSIASRSKMYIALELCDAGDFRVFMQ